MTVDLEDQRREGILAARRRMFDPRSPRAAQAAASMVETVEEWDVRVVTWWATDREKRIAMGACADCGEKLCPKVGGRDATCCP